MDVLSNSVAIAGMVIDKSERIDLFLSSARRMMEKRQLPCLDRDTAPLEVGYLALTTNSMTRGWLSLQASCVIQC